MRLPSDNPYFAPHAPGVLSESVPVVPDFDPSTVAVLAFDGKWFEQGRLCIETLRRNAPAAMDIVVIEMGLSAKERRQLGELGCRTVPMPTGLKMSPGSPAHTRAMWVRPYLRDVVPGYNVYFWVDSDIRFLTPDSVEIYVRFANLPHRPVVATAEFDQAYIVYLSADRWARFASQRRRRIAPIWGDDAADAAGNFTEYNAGLWAMHRDSAIWDLYREHLEVALDHPYERLAEQDSMNLAILKSGMQVWSPPSHFNWICSMAYPAFNVANKTWVRPSFPFTPIAALHLTDQSSTIDTIAGTLTNGENYSRLGMMRAGVELPDRRLATSATH